MFEVSSELQIKTLYIPKANIHYIQILKADYSFCLK